MADEDLTAIKVAIAELATDMKHVSHDVKGITQRLDAYATQRDLGAVVTRVEVLESNQRRAAWAIISAWVAGLGTVGALIAKKF